MTWMIKNSDGKKDALLTFAAWTVFIILLRTFVAGIKAVVGANSFGFSDMDAGVIAALLTPTLGAYVARRATEHAWPAAPGVTTTTVSTERVVAAKPSALPAAPAADIKVDKMTVDNLEVKEVKDVSTR